MLILIPISFRRAGDRRRGRQIVPCRAVPVDGGGFDVGTKTLQPD